MDTLLVASPPFPTLEKLTEWGNHLLGKTAPSSPNYLVRKIVHFELVSGDDGFSALLLVEVERKKSSSSMVLSMRKDMGLSPEESDD